MGSRTKPSPREQPYIQSASSASKSVRAPEYYNPYPFTWLIGPPNEAMVEVNGITTYAIIDTGAQITMIAYSFVRQLKLEIHDLNEVIQVEGTGEFMVLYLRYIEVNLRRQQFPQYEVTILMLVIPDNQYTYVIPIQIGTWQIQKVMQMVNNQNFNELMEAWRNTYVSTITVSQLVLGKVTEDVFNLSVGRGSITTSQEVTLAPFEMQNVSGVSKVTGHVK